MIAKHPLRRTFWSVNLDEDYRTGDGDGRRVTTEAEANCVSSLLEDGRSAPLLDLDCIHEYRASTTPGHGHLLIDVPMTWWQYRRLLKMLGRLGILEPGYVRAALRRGHNEARLPRVQKPKPKPPPAPSPEAVNSARPPEPYLGDSYMIARRRWPWR